MELCIIQMKSFGETTGGEASRGSDETKQSWQIKMKEKIAKMEAEASGSRAAYDVFIGLKG